jgi:hypothetical protein
MDLLPLQPQLLPPVIRLAGQYMLGTFQRVKTKYEHGLMTDASVDELLNLVRFGPIENVKLLPEKACVFISFLDGSTAAAFHADASVKKLALHGQELKIGWGKASQLPASIGMAVQQAQATRNVFLGNLDPNDHEEKLRNELGQFGPIDQIKIVRDKNIGFVHFLSISTAMKVVAQLPTLPGWEEKRVNYGKVGSALVPRPEADTDTDTDFRIDVHMCQKPNKRLSKLPKHKQQLRSALSRPS